MKTKVRCNTFTVKAHNMDCKDAILAKAKEQQIKVKKQRCHSNCRLHLVCSSEKWRQFYREIRGLCVVEPTVMCKCPAWLCKTMIKNLRAAATNSRLNQDRAKKASTILATIK